MLQPQQIAPQGPTFSPLIMGYWRLMEWGMTPQQCVKFIEHHLSLGVTTVDHADIYGDYRCEATFGDALKLAPGLREKLQIVTKCGIATRAKAEHRIGHYITEARHILQSAENSLRHFNTDYLDLLLIHRPDPFPISHRHSSRCCSRGYPLPWRPTNWKFHRWNSRHCWMARWINASNCVCARWHGRVWAVVVSLTIRIISRCGMLSLSDCGTP